MEASGKAKSNLQQMMSRHEWEAMSEEARELKGLSKDIMTTTGCIIRTCIMNYRGDMRNNVQ